MFISVPNLRTQRSFAGKAPVIKIDETDSQEKAVVFQKASPVEWKPSKYTKQLYYACFRKW